MKEENKRKFFMTLLYVVLAGALVCGVAGQLIAGEKVNNALFRTLMMFTLSYSWEPANVLVDIARFLAAIFTLSAVVTLIFNAFQIIIDRIRGARKGSTFIYGDNENSKVLLDNDRKAIHGIHGFVSADNYILVDDEEKNLIFCMEHRDQLKGKRVYMQTESLPGVLFSDSNIRAFCVEEIAGKIFWERYNLIRQAYDENGKPRKLTVSLIGWGKLGEQILYYGLLANSFAEVTYHIFGDSHIFEKLHEDHLNDLNIKTYEKDWYDHIDVIRNSDMVIIAEQNNQIRLISELFLISAEIRVVVCSAFRGDEENKRLLLQNRAGNIPEKNLTFYNWRKTAHSMDSVQSEDRLLGTDPAETETGQSVLVRKIRDNWDSIDTFKRYAYLNLLNLSSIYEELRKAWGSFVTEDEMIRLTHVRLCNYYWYHNWNYSRNPDPDDPMADENPKKRLQRRLRPLEDLSENEKDFLRTIVRDFVNN